MDARFTFKVGIYAYHHGNAYNTTYVWHINDDAAEEELSNEHYKIRTEIKKQLPTYHTCCMHREYMDICKLHLNKQPKAKLRRIYKELTNDTSAAETTNQKEIDKRVRLAFELNDRKIICDLRELNKGRPGKYDEFWALSKDFLEGTAQEAVVAVDERRHNPIVHLVQAISVHDLLNSWSRFINLFLWMINIAIKSANLGTQLLKQSKNYFILERFMLD